MIAWDQALNVGALVEISRLISLIEAGQLDDGTSSPYGLGWQISRQRGRRVMWLDGVFIGSSTYVSGDPDRRLTAILLTNKVGAATETVAKRIASCY